MGPILAVTVRVDIIPVVCYFRHQSYDSLIENVKAILVDYILVQLGLKLTAGIIYSIFKKIIGKNNNKISAFFPNT